MRQGQDNDGSSGWRVIQGHDRHSPAPAKSDRPTRREERANRGRRRLPQCRFVRFFISICHLLQINIGRRLIAVQPVALMQNIGHIHQVFRYVDELVTIALTIVGDVRPPFKDARRVSRISHPAARGKSIKGGDVIPRGRFPIYSPLANWICSGSR